MDCAERKLLIGWLGWAGDHPKTTRRVMDIGEDLGGHADLRDLIVYVNGYSRGFTDGREDAFDAVSTTAAGRRQSPAMAAGRVAARKKQKAGRRAARKR